MKVIRMVWNHNKNNFYFSVSLYLQLYSKGSLTRLQLLIGLMKSVRERMRFYHWVPDYIA